MKIYTGGEKMRNASSHQGENEWKQKNNNNNKPTGTHTSFPPSQTH